MLHVVKVEPAMDGWLMRSGASEPLSFDTSAQAVWSAGKVAESLAEAGRAAEVMILDRQGRIAGRIVFEPAQALELA